MLLKKLHFPTLLLVAVTIAAILCNILFDFDILQPLEYKVYDSMTRLRQRKAATKVVVLAIDDQSIQQLGSWPWPRSYIAEMVQLLSSYGTHTMGISLLYPTRELNPGLQEIENIKEILNDKPSKSGRKTATKIRSILTEAGKRLNHDDRLISAVRSARNVVLPLRFTIGGPGDGNSQKLSSWLEINSIKLKGNPQAQTALPVDSSRFRGIFNNHRIQVSRITEPYHDLSTKAGALGHINLIGDNDGIVRNMPLLITYQERDFVSFALQVARKYSGGDGNFYKEEGDSDTGGQARDGTGLQADQGQGHWHNVDVGNVGHTGLSTAGKWGNVAGAGNNMGYTGATSTKNNLVLEAVTDGVNGTPRTGTHSESKNRLIKTWERTS